MLRQFKQPAEASTAQAGIRKDTTRITKGSFAKMGERWNLKGSG